jgi:hypothetical protein
VQHIQKSKLAPNKNACIEYICIIFLSRRKYKKLHIHTWGDTPESRVVYRSGAIGKKYIPALSHYTDRGVKGNYAIYI